MVILGIDPGTRATGYGVIEVAGGRERVRAFGVIAPGGAASGQHLDTIYRGLLAVLDAHPADACAVEMPVYGRNAQAMLKLGRAQAAAMLAALHREVPVVQYTPAEVKKGVTGHGNAPKARVARMVCALLDLPGLEHHDAADALATALCHAHRVHPKARAGGGPFRDWKAFVAAHPERVRR